MRFLIIYIMLNNSFQKEARPTGVSQATKMLCFWRGNVVTLLFKGIA